MLHYAPRLIGEDPTSVGRHWQILYRYDFERGGVVLNSVLSAIDMALWDIQGKALAISVYRLLGGPMRGRIRAYSHAGAPVFAPQLVELGIPGVKTAGCYANENIDERKIPSNPETTSPQFDRQSLPAVVGYPTDQGLRGIRFIVLRRAGSARQSGRSGGVA